MCQEPSGCTTGIKDISSNQNIQLLKKVMKTSGTIVLGKPPAKIKKLIELVISSHMQVEQPATSFSTTRHHRHICLNSLKDQPPHQGRSAYKNIMSSQPTTSINALN